MTQKSYSVSPKPSVRLKPGTNLPGLRPPASGDTHVARVSQPARIPSSTEEVCPALSDPFRAFWHLPAERTFSLNPGSQHSRQRPGLRRSHVALPREAHFALISPAWYRAFLRRTAKRFFFFSQPSLQITSGVCHSALLCHLCVCHFLRVFVDFVGGPSGPFRPPRKPTSTTHPAAPTPSIASIASIESITLLYFHGTHDRLTPAQLSTLNSQPIFPT